MFREPLSWFELHTGIRVRSDYARSFIDFVMMFSASEVLMRFFNRVVDETCVTYTGIGGENNLFDMKSMSINANLRPKRKPETKRPCRLIKKLLNSIKA